MQAIKLSDRVFWVGAIDWNVRDFHGYLTSRGTTYNAYLILGEKITLIDTVKAPFMDEMFARIASIINPNDIDYIISNHSEMDHTGALPQTIKAVKPEKVFASVMGVKALNNHFTFDKEILALKDGENLNLGNMNLTFYETRMIHWPDSMITYLHDKGILFSQDGFGMHLASSERFDDELNENILEQEAAKYYANILLPFSPLITKFIERLGTLKLAPKMIAPDHGPVWRQGTKKILGLYSKWALQRPTKKAVIFYDTMWQSTARMAREIGDGLISNGVSMRIMPLSSCHRSNVATELLGAGALIVGSPTINNNMFPTVSDALCYIKGLKPQNLVGAVFGSYGWSGEATKHIAQILEEMNVRLVVEPLSAKYVPTKEDMEKCFKLGETVANKLI